MRLSWRSHWAARWRHRPRRSWRRVRVRRQILQRRTRWRRARRQRRSAPSPWPARWRRCSWRQPCIPVNYPGGRGRVPRNRPDRPRTAQSGCWARKIARAESPCKKTSVGMKICCFKLLIKCYLITFWECFWKFEHCNYWRLKDSLCSSTWNFVVNYLNCLLLFLFTK